ncbi:GNAT family N-acetyltransferase [Saccharopolyspora sp. MS10]|uniref:GNAT family N-acetyltransferase n=1 Tax=Saccharopolyspora sp. MS10 TaxID=3385973 RepID=UPI0039A22132
MSESRVQITDRPERHRFEATVDGALAGFADYVRRPGRIELTHTEVDQRHQGRGVAGQLARAAFGSARERGEQVVPLCPYMAEFVRKHPDQLDLLGEDDRARLAQPQG